MDKDNPLDRHLDANKRIPRALHDTATEVADLLDLAWKVTQSVFGSRATPDLALVVFDRMVSRSKSGPGPGTN